MSVIIALSGCAGARGGRISHSVPSSPAWSCAYIWPGHDRTAGLNHVKPPCRNPVPRTAIRRVLASTVEVWSKRVVSVASGITLTGWFNGTGVILRDDGSVATAYHVVHDAKEFKVVYHRWSADGRTYLIGEEVMMTVVKVTPENDAAWLRPVQPPRGPVPPPLVVCRRWPRSGEVLWHTGSDIAWSMATVGVASMHYRAKESTQVVHGFDVRTLGRHGDSGAPLFDGQARVYGLYVSGGSVRPLSGCGTSIDAALTAMGEHAQYEESCE